MRTLFLVKDLFQWFNPTALTTTPKKKKEEKKANNINKEQSTFSSSLISHDEMKGIDGYCPPMHARTGPIHPTHPTGY